MNIELFTAFHFWDYIVIDETGGAEYANDDFCLLMKILGKCKVFVTRDDVILRKSLKHFHNIVCLLFQNINENLLLPILSKDAAFSKNYWFERSKLIAYFRELRLKRSREEISDDLPLIDKEVSICVRKNNGFLCLNIFSKKLLGLIIMFLQMSVQISYYFYYFLYHLFF